MNDALKQQVIKGGKDFLELGNWRIGMYDKNHFVFSHKSGYSSVIYRSDGTIHPGPRKDFSLWERQCSAVSVIIGKNFLQFGQVWRLSQIDDCHLSLGQLSGYTCMIWRVDGTKHCGPRKDYNGFFQNNYESCINVGQNFVQIGYWKIGQVDNMHMSIGTQTLVADIYRSDGTIHPGPRMDYRIKENPKFKSVKVL